MANKPSAEESNGRASNGRFVTGNSGGPGNPLGKRVHYHRVAFMNAVSEDDITAIAKALVKKAKGGDTAAAKTVLERMSGRAHIDEQFVPMAEVCAMMKAFSGMIMAAIPDQETRLAVAQVAVESKTHKVKVPS